MERDRDEERRQLEEWRTHLAEFEGNPHDPDSAAIVSASRLTYAELEERVQELEFELYGGRDEGDKGVLRWLRFYEEIASIWAYEARKSREAIEELLRERQGQGQGNADA